MLGESGPARPSPPGGLAEGSWWRVGAGAILAGQAMAVGLAVNLSPPEGPARPLLHGLLAASALAVLGLLGWPLARAAWESSCRRRIGVELLFLAGIIGAFGASLWASATGRGAVYYEVVAVLLTVYTAGRALTAQARGRAWAETRKLRDAFALARRVGPDGGVKMVPAGEIQPGDRIRVDPGEGVPVDGRVVAGECFVRETPLTGEPHPVARRPGDTLWAGSYAEDGTLLLEAAAPGNQRRLDALLEAVEAGRDSLEGTRAQGQADRLAGWFLPVVLLTSIATLVAWGASGRWADGLFHALSVLLVACPCALGLATPLAWWHGLASLAARGIVIRRAETLERLAMVTRVAFDKTGTLSESGASLVDFVAAGTPAERRRLRGWVRAIQQRCPHPVARAFGRIDEETEPADPPVEIAAWRTVPGSGVEAWVIAADGDEHRVQVGRPEWVSAGADLPGTSPEWSAGLRARPGDLVIQVAVDGVVRGLAAVRERLRPSVPEMIRELQRLGVGMAVLTGDRSDRVATLVGDWPGLEVAGAQQPADKAERIRGWQRDGQVVAFVGDGINDAPALGQADVGCALHGGADLARAAAGVVLTGDDPAGVVEAVRTARRVTASIRGSLVFAAGYNLAGMALAASGRLHPVVAALLMTGSSAAVAWRACRPWPGSCGPAESEPGEAVGSRWREGVLVAGFLVQWPGLCLLGRLGGWTAAALAVALALLAAGALGWERAPRRDRAGRGVVRMLLWMAGPGNVGMLAGWWVDAGFQPVMQEGVCLCCRSHDYFRAGGGVPWMWLGMLATGLPSMGPWLVGVAGRGTGRALLAAGAGAGMLGGMWLGGDAVLAWAGPGHPQQFVLAWAGMTAGMLAGMGFACAVGEALRATLGRRPGRRARGPATPRPGAAGPGGTGPSGLA